MVAKALDLSAAIFHCDSIGADTNSVEFDLEDATAHFLTQTDTRIA